MTITRPLRLAVAVCASVSALLAAGCSSLAPPAGAQTVEVAAPAPAPVAPPPAAPAAAPPSPEPVAAVAAAPEAPPRPRPPTPPRGRLDPDVDAERASLWERLRGGMAMPDLDDEWVRKWEQFYATRPDYVQRMMERGSRYLFHIVEAVDKRGMPMELALLPFIESAFNPQALSRASASGMWQFMPGTGKELELRQNLFRDDRRDVLASTTAALDYLGRLQARFGDWHLALAAYNWGMGNLQRALDRHQREGRPTDYASLRGMPNETRDYVRKLQAMKNIVLRPQAYALELPPLENHPFFVSLPIEHDIDVALVARLSGLSIEEFQQLNPQLKKPVILAAGTPQVLLPYDNANRYVRALRQHRGSHASWTAWVAPRTLKPAEAAKIVGMPEQQLREVNAIPARMLVKVGSTLLVPRTSDSGGNVSEHIADHAALALAPEARKAPPGRHKAEVKGASGRGHASKRPARRATASVASKRPVQAASPAKASAGRRSR
ncbi:MAG: transglycosylase SLT domain-containing protein [Rubrivivax sp.]|nr:transglycosylase SLT domain-containing protein [Rubrivivax sp.]